MTSFDVIALDIAAAGWPVLFLDTCSLLDVVRRSTNRYLRGHAEATLELLRLASRPLPGCSLVISSLMQSEWDANIRTVIDEANRHLLDMEEQSDQIHQACQSIEIKVGPEPTRYASLGLPERLRDLSDQLLKKALRLDPHQESRDKAIERVLQNTPPAKKGAQLMDCIIIEDTWQFAGESGRLGARSGSFSALRIRETIAIRGISCTPPSRSSSKRWGSFTSRASRGPSTDWPI